MKYVIIFGHAVPFAIRASGQTPNAVQCYDKVSCVFISFGAIHGDAIIPVVLRK